MANDIKAYLLAIDPGRCKCGIAVFKRDCSVIYRANMPTENAQAVLVEIIDRFHPGLIAVGNGTGSDTLCSMVKELEGIELIVVPEKNTTLEARELAWQENPPGGIFRILPKIFWPNPSDLDSWAAVVIGRRALDGKR
jgi:hypothetical protein